MPKRRVALVVAVAAVVSSCGGGGGDGGEDEPVDVSLERQSAPPGESVAPDGSTVDASVPEVAVPASAPTELVVTELRAGSGPEAAAGDVVLVNYVGVRRADGAQFDANYGADPLPVVIGQGMVIEGWDQGLVGVQAGEQLQLDIPAELAYGDEPPGADIQPGDALSFVIDVISVGKGSPVPTTEELPVDDEPVTELVVADARVGEGAALEAGQDAFFDLLLARGDTGEVLQSSWEPDAPARVAFGAEGTAPFLVEGLTGMRVGGRRVLTVPFAEVFANPAEAAELGIPDGTDLIVVADLLTTF